MNACLFVICLALSGPEARRPDRLFGEDKLQHFFVSALVTGLSAGAARAAGLDADDSLLVGAGVGAAVGAAKEIRDLGQPGETPSVLDFAWDLAGVGAATALVAQTH